MFSFIRTCTSSVYLLVLLFCVCRFRVKVYELARMIMFCFNLFRIIWTSEHIIVDVFLVHCFSLHKNLVWRVSLQVLLADSPPTGILLFWRKYIFPFFLRQDPLWVPWCPLASFGSWMGEAEKCKPLKQERKWNFSGRTPSSPKVTRTNDYQEQMIFLFGTLAGHSSWFPHMWKIWYITGPDGSVW